MTRVSVLRDVTIILPFFQIWSGGSRMDSADYVGINDDELPPEVAASRGAKKLIDPSVLRPLSRYRGKAERICASAGVRFLNGWAVPNGDVKTTVKKLEAVIGEFDADLARFFDDYETLVDEWVNHLAQDRPDFAAKINEARIPRGRVEMRFGRSLSVFRVSGSDQDQADTMSGARDSLREQVLNSVWAEFGMVAEKLRFVPNGFFKVSIRAKFRRISDRLTRFGFCDETGMFRRFIAALEPFQNGQGTIVEAEYQALRNLFSNVVDPVSLEDAIVAASPALVSGPAWVPATLDLPAPPVASFEAAAEPETPAEPDASLEVAVTPDAPVIPDVPERAEAPVPPATPELAPPPDPMPDLPTAVRAPVTVLAETPVPQPAPRTETPVPVPAAMPRRRVVSSLNW
ncbi:MAG: hypothetical protein DI556_13500 [Rhodovulum sulfidophilum]|uniref:DUF3150 domain-containing protein n=1 Tax=Rhodovulum sulfidophilum TaxID=35806 RepID=A0A2W5NDL7_RHOSU|nr:MAG: hypothetical protein DI556_13500 [Rhodovulum sulfidophilum]